jgi:two-component system, cell cycle sensor histidine kinase and response regulator CckA
MKSRENPVALQSTSAKRESPEMELPENTNPEAATVLVVDDDHQLLTFCGNCLSRHGFTVLQVDDGLQALLIAASHGRPIDILVTDIELPGIRGTELGDVFKLIWPHTKVLYMSGSLDRSVQLELRLHRNFLPKPFLPDALVKTVDRMLAGR